MEGKEFVYYNTSPLIGVIQDEYIDKIILKNQIPSFVDLIIPFGERMNGILTHDALGSTIQVDPCYLRFENANQLNPVSQETILSAVMNKVMPDYGVECSLPVLKNRLQVEKYREQVLIVLSSANPQPLATLERLGSPNNMPEIYKSGFMDPKVTKVCLLLHDPEESIQIDQTVVSQMKHLFPTHVLSINNASATPTSEVPDIWTSYLAEKQPLDNTPGILRRPSQELFHFRARANSIGHGRGCRLSQQDFAAIGSFIKDFLAPRVFETISRQMREWEKEVASVRRGISGRLFKVGLKYFGGTNKTATASPGAFTDPKTLQTVFPFSSQEFIMRRLGDFAFMIRDFKYAQSIYESVKKDFSTSEKYQKYFAGINEMLALTSLMQASNSGFENYQTIAVQSYSDAKYAMFGDRATIWVVELIKEYGAYRDAAFTLIKMARDNVDLKCALFLEQAAICFIRSAPPLPRRYAFHLFLAAHRYSKSGFQDHAERNYRTALEIYGDLGWSLITDHINFNLGKQALKKLEYDQAIEIFIKLLHRSRQLPQVHRGYLSEFLYLYQEYANNVGIKSLAEKVSNLPIPEFSCESITISAQDENTKQKSSNDESGIWMEMEKELLQNESIPGFVGDKTAYNGGGMKSKISNQEYAVGEPLRLKFEWSNPMQVPIPVNNIFLECLFNDEPITIPDWGDSEPPSWIETPQLKMELLADVALDSNERKTVSIKLFPLMQGQLKIIGLRYLLCGIIPATRRFDSTSTNIVIDITAPMPVLDYTFHNFPEEMLNGQISQATLELHNKGGKGLVGLAVKISHPNFCYFGDTKNPEDSYIELLPDASTEFNQHITVSNIIKNHSVVSVELPLGDNSEKVLEPNMTTLVPVWVRADQSGKHTIRLSFIYYPINANPGDGYRTLQITKTVDVHASIRVCAFTRPSFHHMNEFVVGIDVTNIRSGPELIIRQLVSISPRWKISLIDDRDPISSHIQTSDTRFFFLKATRIEKNTTKLEKTPEFLTTFALEKLILGEDSKPWQPPDIDLELTSIAKKGYMGSCLTTPFRSFSQICRSRSRLIALHQQYPTMSKEQLTNMFSLYWSDDIDIACFYECPSGIHGHITITGLTLSLESPLPIESWFSGLDAKALAGRALFERTFRERKELVDSLFKNKLSDSSPVRLILNCKHQVEIGADGFVLVPIEVYIGNTSWMHEAHYNFEAVNGNNNVLNSIDPPVFSWSGKTKFVGTLRPLESTVFTINAAFTHQGVYDINRWKLETKLAFPKELIDASAQSKLERIGGQFTQSPSVAQLLEVI